MRWKAASILEMLEVELEKEGIECELVGNKIIVYDFWLELKMHGASQYLREDVKITLSDDWGPIRYQIKNNFKDVINVVKNYKSIIEKYKENDSLNIKLHHTIK